MSKKLPLIVDVDGTFIKTDMLFEGFWQAMGKTPFETLQAAGSDFFNRAQLKARIARIADIDVSLLPVNPDVVALVEQAREEGREVLFASAGDQQLVNRLADQYGLQADHLASDGTTNLKGATKALALVERFGQGGYAYVGDARADLSVWLQSGEAIMVGNLQSERRQLQAAGVPVSVLPKTWSRRSMAAGLRPHQWVKNVLLLLPLIAAHQFDLQSLLLILVATMSFCAAASSIYLVNDMLDLEADRLHPKKRYRPIAAGNIKIRDAMSVSILLGLFALILGSLLGGPFLTVVALYMGLSLVYSLKIKRIRWLDILALAALFTLRVLAGALAAQVFASIWLVAFVFPAFLALGAVKRLTELTLARSDGVIPGRGYTPADRRKLLDVACVAAGLSLAVFFIYTFSATAAALYPTLWALQLAGVPYAIWQARMIYLGWHGQQDYDPLVFAMKDVRGLALSLICLAMILYGAGGF